MEAYHNVGGYGDHQYEILGETSHGRVDDIRYYQEPCCHLSSLHFVVAQERGREGREGGNN